MLKQKLIETPLGTMIAVADDEALYELQFADMKLKCKAEKGETKIHKSIEKELRDYFTGKLKAFKTPLAAKGTPFQKKVWAALSKIPHGQTRSYEDVAKVIGRPTAFRAVARANATNPIAIVVPCHRVINKSKALGGYAGGLERKKQLLDLEA